MTKKILIVENFVHFRNAVETKKLFSIKYNCNLIINHNQKNKIEFKDQKNAIFYKGPSFLIYLYILIISKKYDYIIISTLPEYPENLYKLKNIIFTLLHYSSFFFSFIFIKKKLIFQIRNIYAFIPRKKTFLSKLRYLLLNISEKYIFENKYLADKFRNKKNFKLKKITYQYINHYNSDAKTYDKKKNYIGILGGIDSTKKDYQLLFNVLKKLDRKKIKFSLIFLGKLVDKDSINILKKFRIFNIRYFKNYIKEKKFKYWGYKCKFLISPLKINSKYRDFKPTGSFGDSIYLRKKLIINSKMDPYKEFRDISIYYQNNNDFYKKIKSTLMKKKLNIKKKFPNGYDHIIRIKKNLFI